MLLILHIDEPHTEAAALAAGSLIPNLPDRIHALLISDKKPQVNRLPNLRKAIRHNRRAMDGRSRPTSP